MTELQALRDTYRQHKAALLASLQAQGASTRGIHVLLRKFSRLADGLLTTLWQRAGLPPGLALAAVGGFGARAVVSALRHRRAGAAAHRPART
jgi:[protein-PII] uridylyltransferase